MGTRVPTSRRPFVPPEKRRPYAEGPGTGPNHEPLNEKEAKHWARLEADVQIRARRDAPHDARMLPRLGLCSECWGWVDDPRHLQILLPG